ncbi:hypothetical protein FH608_023920 [Nonomuraea phyllanthi]|uniref:Uncharacterized protein n=1 Tax=Nonomuraea phyllanthi TaxID=2219224 RepID=A0A5C4WBJ3_9ACTN|nr:hypothetical protein [Nonomuraea phyllanthi]KAB8192557.1 hypothetical protein FH608_023920 [Nonomuraea phyllanthi]QFY08036.1 hypothetical protein GBF35_16320 [Nonomuraea phyllanthi]
MKIQPKHKVAGMLVVDRDYAIRTPEDWNVPGVYLLMDRPDAEGRWGAYVGKATTSGLRKRVLEQLERGHWYRALLIRSEGGHQLHSGEAAWLEGKLYDGLADAAQVDLHNRNRPRDLTLSDEDETSLVEYLQAVPWTLRLLGHTLHPSSSVADGGTPLLEMIEPELEKDTAQAEARELREANAAAKLKLAEVQARIERARAKAAE